MLICPQCNFENPDQNRFCQRCGHALLTWQVVLIPRPSADSNAAPIGSEERPISGVTESASEAVEGSASRLTLADVMPSWPYLESSHRYQLQGTSGAQPLQDSFVATVIDCTPTAGSPIAHLQDKWLQDPDLDLEALDPAERLPAEAIPYLALQADFFPSIPELHHAWEAPSHAVLLFEDRLTWPTLADQLSQVPGNSLQHLHWLFEAVSLWEALIPWRQQGSLLRRHWLTLDEDHILCLKQLDPNPPAEGPMLAELGALWLDIFENAQIALADNLRDLLKQVVSGQLSSSRLRDALAVLADDLDQAVPLASAAPLALAEEPEGAVFWDDPSPTDPLGAATVTTTQPPDIAEESDIDRQIEASPSDSITLEAQLTQLNGVNAVDAASDPLNLDVDDDETEGGIELPTMVLPMKLVRLDEVGQTHVGRQREHNEDFFWACSTVTRLDSPTGPSLNAEGIYILCDGMGGHASGEVASSMAVKTLQSYLEAQWVDRSALPDETLLQAAILEANQAIYTLNQNDERSGSGRMGTTLVMLLVKNTQAVVAHVGDSRLYAFSRRPGLQQMTVDHEVGQREIQRGVEPAIAYARPDAYQLTQALGPRGPKDVKPTITYLDVAEDTLFLLCSDGLSDNDLLEQHHPTHIEPLLSSRADLEDGLSKLIELANEHNGHDNITAVLIRLKLRPNMDKLPVQ